MFKTAIVSGLLVLSIGSSTLDLSFDKKKIYSDTPDGWKAIEFEKIQRHTEYMVIQDGDIVAVKAVADNSASGLGYSLDMAADELPVLRWKWKVQSTLKDGDATDKRKDDFPARVYVSFRYEKGKAGFFERLKFSFYKKLQGEYPIHSALNYVWANKLPKGAHMPSSYTDRAIIVATESGNQKAGQWIEEQVNIVEDYKKYFGAHPPPLAGIMIMSDTDNTMSSAQAWYADISLSAQ